jgi:hypothetical protein
MLLPVMLVVLWPAVLVVLVAACRMAARGDRALTADAARRSKVAPRKRMRECGPAAARIAPAIARHEPRPRFMARSSQPAASDDVREGAQEDLDVCPERPVSHIQIVHHRHLPQR